MSCLKSIGEFILQRVLFKYMNIYSNHTNSIPVSYIVCILDLCICIVTEMCIGYSTLLHTQGHGLTRPITYGPELTCVESWSYSFCNITLTTEMEFLKQQRLIEGIGDRFDQSGKLYTAGPRPGLWGLCPLALITLDPEPIRLSVSQPGRTVYFCWTGSLADN